MTAKNIVMAAAGARQVDPNDSYTSLVLLGEGSNGGQNKTFLDSSDSPNAITRYGNTTQGTFSPFSKEAGKWGVAFDGNGDYLESSLSSAISLGAGDFTFEYWVYRNAVTDLNYADTTVSGKVDFNGISFGIDPSGKSGFALSSNGSSWDIRLGIDPGQPKGSITIPLNQWTHIALVRSGTNFTGYVNGQVDQTFTSSSSIYPISGIRIGRCAGSWGRYWNGYISNVRITKGAALYTTTFTPSTAPLTTTVASPGTVSLLTCQDNRFKDSSVNNFTLTPYGDVKVTPFSPFSNNLAYSPSVHGGSGYFDGSGDYLSVPNATALNFSNSNWTASVDIFITPGSSGYRPIFAKRTGATISYELFIDTDGSIAIYNGTIYDSGVVPSSGCWHTITINATATSATVSLNGSSILTTPFTITEQNVPLLIGQDGNNTWFNGYISNVILTKNSTEVLKLLFTNGAIIDSTGKNNLETVGNAQVSTSVRKSGNGAMYFDGTGDCLTLPSSQALTMGTGDFTIEAWVYPGSQKNAYNCLLGGTTSGALGINLYGAGTSSQLKLNPYGSADIASISYTFTQDTWAHIAVARAGTSLLVFINGVQVGSTISNSTNFSASSTCIGAVNNGAAQTFTGYIDELRITKGKALYTSNFTPTSIANYY